MSEHLQALLIFSSVLTAVIALATASVGALCYFLRQLVSVTLPAMLDRFAAEQSALRGQHDRHITMLVARVDRLAGARDAESPNGQYDATPHDRGADN